MFVLPSEFLEDTRSGIAVTSSISLQYNAQADLGTVDGIEIIAFFEKVPFIITKKNFKVLAKPYVWENFIANDLRNSYENFATTNIGTLIETANAEGGKVVIDSELYYAGTISVAEYSSTLLEFNASTQHNVAETKSFSMPVGGHWEGESIAKGKIYSSAPNFGYQATKTFVGGDASVTEAVGDLATIASVTGRITSISKSGYKLASTSLGLQPIFDWSISLQATLGTDV